jgi:iron complex outermembrane receptor protein
VFNISPSYTWHTGQGDLNATVNWFHTSEYFWESANYRRQDAYSLINANLGWTDSTGKFGVNLWGKNLGRTEYQLYMASQFTGDSFAAAAPRTYGISFNMKLK